jgi:hypothetical protein
LNLVRLSDSFDAFQFQDDARLDHGVWEEFSDNDAVINDLKGRFDFHAQADLTKLVHERIMVNRFNESRPQRAVNRHGAPNDPSRQFTDAAIFFHLRLPFLNPVNPVNPVQLSSSS